MSFLSRIARITDNLYLSGAAAVRQDTLYENNIKCVINATMDVPPLNVPGVVTLKICVDDTPSAQLSPHFDKCIEQIEKTRRQGGSTLVHCMAGVSRSASICIAYLMKTRRLTLREAFHYVKERRPVIRPNPGFFRQLISYEKHLFGCNSVRMVTSPIGSIPDLYEEQTRNMVFLSPPKHNFKSLMNRLT